jgi:uncharacterized membrane protein
MRIKIIAGFILIALGIITMIFGAIGMSAINDFEYMKSHPNPWAYREDDLDADIVLAVVFFFGIGIFVIGFILLSLGIWLISPLFVKFSENQNPRKA